MSETDERRYALVVATAGYEDPKLRRLRAPAVDAQRLAEVLADAEKGGFEVEVLTDETQTTITRSIARFFRDRRPQDLLLVHFSCHGIKDEHGDLHLAARDTEVDLLSATAVSASWLNAQISRSRSKRTVVLLDCCFAGSFPFGMAARAGTAVDAPEQLQGRGRVIITASSALEYSYEADGLHGEGQPSVFTEAVVDGLDSGAADLDGDGRVSVDELYDYVYDRVRQRTPSQTPSMKSDLQGPLYLARSAVRQEVAPPPAAEAVTATAQPAALLPAAGGWRRHPARVALVGVTAAIALVAVVVLLVGGGGAGTAGATRPAGVPSACKDAGQTQFARDMDAVREWSCPSPYRASDRVANPYFAFLEFPATGTAREAIQAAHEWDRNHGWSGCGPQLPATDFADASCLQADEDHTIQITWRRTDWAVTGYTTFDEPTTVEAGIRAWRRVATAAEAAD